jgi:hypothetical protein
LSRGVASHIEDDACAWKGGVQHLKPTWLLRAIRIHGQVPRGGKPVIVIKPRALGTQGEQLFEAKGDLFGMPLSIRRFNVDKAAVPMLEGTEKLSRVLRRRWSAESPAYRLSGSGFGISLK